MIKNFDSWNSLKKITDNKDVQINFHQQEVWWCSYGLNIGSEQNGIGENFERPIVILKKLSHKTFLCVPLTTKYKQHIFRTPLSANNKESYAIADQIKVLDSKRLLRLIGTADIEEFNSLMKLVKNIL